MCWWWSQHSPFLGLDDMVMVSKSGKLVVSKRFFDFYSYLLREMIQFDYMICFINVWLNHQVDEFIPKSHRRFTKWIPGRGDSGFGHHPGGGGEIHQEIPLKWPEKTSASIIFIMIQQTNKQTNKQTTNQPNKQTNKQANKHVWGCKSYCSDWKNTSTPKGFI